MVESTFICFSSSEGSTSSLVTIDHAGSGPACAAELKPRLRSVRLQDGLCFLQRSSARHRPRDFSIVTMIFHHRFGDTEISGHLDGRR